MPSPSHGRNVDISCHRCTQLGREINIFSRPHEQETDKIWRKENFLLKNWWFKCGTNLIYFFNFYGIFMTYFSCLLCPIHAVFIYCKCRCYAGCKLWRWNSDVKAGPLLPRNCTLYSYTSQIEMYLYLNMPLNEDVEFFLQKQINLILICTVRNTKNRIISHLCFKVWSGFCLEICKYSGKI